MTTQAALSLGALAGIFGLSGVAKVAQPQSFIEFAERALDRGRLAVLKPAAKLLPTLELGVAVALLSPASFVGAYGATALAALFVVGAVLGRRVDGGCGCFGSADATTPHWLTVTRSLILLLVSAATVPFAQGSPLGAAPYSGAVGIVAGVSLAMGSVLVGQLAVYARGPLTVLLGEERA